MRIHTAWLCLKAQPQPNASPAPFSWPQLCAGCRHPRDTGLRHEHKAAKRTLVCVLASLAPCRASVAWWSKGPLCRRFLNGGQRGRTERRNDRKRTTARTRAARASLAVAVEQARCRAGWRERKERAGLLASLKSPKRLGHRKIASCRRPPRRASRATHDTVCATSLAVQRHRRSWTGHRHNTPTPPVPRSCAPHSIRAGSKRSHWNVECSVHCERASRAVSACMGAAWLARARVLRT